jgi:hypothetical protein
VTRLACGSSGTPPFPFPPTGEKPGREGSPHAAGTLRASRKRWHASCWRLPPQEGLPPPLCIPPPASGADALYDANRTLHLLIKPDNLTCYQHANSFDYLTELQRHARELTANPAEWMPWNYRQTLEPPGV